MEFRIYRRIRGGEISLIYVTPERFRSRVFINSLDCRIARDQGLEYFIFDEAHCVSQWGQEFRPDYLHVLDWCRNLKTAHPSTCATFYSATLTGLIEADLRAVFPNVQRVGQFVEDYNPIRDHISMSFRQVTKNDDDHYRAIRNYQEERRIDFQASRMLVFCLRKDECEEVSEYLGGCTVPSVGYFHAGMSGDDRCCVLG